MCTANRAANIKWFEERIHHSFMILLLHIIGFRNMYSESFGNMYCNLQFSIGKWSASKCVKNKWKVTPKTYSRNIRKSSTILLWVNTFMWSDVNWTARNLRMSKTNSSLKMFFVLRACGQNVRKQKQLEFWIRFIIGEDKRGSCMNITPTPRWL